jgi:hypothetical protein
LLDNLRNRKYNPPSNSCQAVIAMQQSFQTARPGEGERDVAAVSRGFGYGPRLASRLIGKEFTRSFVAGGNHRRGGRAHWAECDCIPEEGDRLGWRSSRPRISESTLAHISLRTNKWLFTISNPTLRRSRSSARGMWQPLRPHMVMEIRSRRWMSRE